MCLIVALYVLVMFINPLYIAFHSCYILHTTTTYYTAHTNARLPFAGRWHCSECSYCQSCGCKTPLGDGSVVLDRWRQDNLPIVYLKNKDSQHPIALMHPPPGPPNRVLAWKDRDGQALRRLILSYLIKHYE